MEEKKIKTVLSAAVCFTLLLLMVEIVLYDQWSQRHNINYVHTWITMGLILPAMSAMVYWLFKRHP